MPAPEMSTDLVMNPPGLLCVVLRRTIQMSYPVGQSNWINRSDSQRDRIAAMGNREDLLTGALLCLKEKGWARTTVRDIAAAAGVNHAAIGYHFGSRGGHLMHALSQAEGGY